VIWTFGQSGLDVRLRGGDRETALDSGEDDLA
jgi:hypothetical protein